MGAVTRKKNEIIQLMENVCNVEVVKSKMETQIVILRKEMEELNESVQALMSTKGEIMLNGISPKGLHCRKFAT